MLCDRIYCLEDIDPLVEKILGGAPPEASLDQKMDMKLCLFEILSNTIRHRTYAETGPMIAVFWTLDSEGLTFQLCCDGKMKAEASPGPPQLKYPQNLTEGGCGLFLVSSLADDFSYSEDFSQIDVKLLWKKGGGS